MKKRKRDSGLSNSNKNPVCGSRQDLSQCVDVNPQLCCKAQLCTKVHLGQDKRVLIHFSARHRPRTSKLGFGSFTG